MIEFLLVLFAALFVTGPILPSNETPRCLIVNAAMEQVRACRPCEFERWAC